MFVAIDPFCNTKVGPYDSCQLVSPSRLKIRDRQVLAFLQRLKTILRGGPSPVF